MEEESIGSVSPLDSIVWWVKRECFVTSDLKSLWFVSGWSPGGPALLLPCWEMCSDFKPAFSLDDFQSFSSGRAET